MKFNVNLSPRTAARVRHAEAASQAAAAHAEVARLAATRSVAASNAIEDRIPGPPAASSTTTAATLPIAPVDAHDPLGDALRRAREADRAVADAANTVAQTPTSDQGVVGQVDVPVARLVAIFGAVGTLMTAISGTLGGCVQRSYDQASSRQSFQRTVLNTALSYPSVDDRKAYLNLALRFGLLDDANGKSLDPGAAIPSAPLPSQPPEIPTPSPSATSSPGTGAGSDGGHGAGRVGGLGASNGTSGAANGNASGSGHLQGNKNAPGPGSVKLPGQN